MSEARLGRKPRPHYRESYVRSQDLSEEREIAHLGIRFGTLLREFLKGERISAVLYAGDFVEPSYPLRIEVTRYLQRSQPVDYQALTARFMEIAGLIGTMPQTERLAEVPIPTGFPSRAILKLQEDSVSRTLITNRRTYPLPDREDIVIDVDEYQKRFHQRHPISGLWTARRLNGKSPQGLG